MTEERY